MTEKTKTLLHSNWRESISGIFYSAVATMPVPLWLDPDDPSIAHHAYIPLDLASRDSRRAYEDARSYCEDQFPHRYSWRAFPARQIAEFGFTSEIEAVQFTLWSPDHCEPPGGGVAALTR